MLQKPILSSNRDEPQRYYDIKFTTGLFKRRPSLINRPKIPQDLEKQIRWSSVLLAESILDQDEQTLPAKQTNTAAPEELKTSQAATEIPAPIELGAAPTATDTDAMCDSAVDLRTRRAARQATEAPLTSPFHDLNETSSISNHGSSSVSSPATTCSDMTFATGHSSIEPSIKSPVPNERQAPFEDFSGCTSSQDKEGLTFLTGKYHQPFSPEDIEVFLNSDSTLVLGRMPSLSRPPTSTSYPTHKQHLGPNIQAPAQDNTVLPTENKKEAPSQPPSPKKNYRSKFIEFGATVDKDDDATPPPAVIVDSNGVRHAITHAEATRRNIDLQLAVQEKMHTGIIASASVPALSPSKTDKRTPADTARCKKLPFWPFKAPASGHSQPDCQPAGKNKSFIFQKLSFFDFTKRNVGAARSKDTAGFSRMVEDT
ncbi:uncharacterized protein ACLA_010460 [Aspergillus clavatus NRRL 1]|uniref:Uncharacterized protein n=1 Tax=Aspergillus clavatus (strain ATCC 1007 / CBS 513.65 / DSM 816 / NCTC 3887 / NRRL 1 / QM 1276 / 107) TaxID=344612 RepID=A1CA52_ASPCL|nr:uncharacterized protein ACLA_010460 [Aspergillus clavatus NRRL 1]EAW12620.1 conserved hypothetical protein [Aspergillus clavatus NRRL 1]